MRILRRHNTIRYWNVVFYRNSHENINETGKKKTLFTLTDVVDFFLFFYLYGAIISAAAVNVVEFSSDVFEPFTAMHNGVEGFVFLSPFFFLSNLSFYLIFFVSFRFSFLLIALSRYPSVSLQLSHTTILLGKINRSRES